MPQYSGRTNIPPSSPHNLQQKENPLPFPARFINLQFQQQAMAVPHQQLK